MADQDNYKTYVRETRTTESSGGGIALIVGGLVVAVGFIVWLVFGTPGPVATTDPVSETTNVTIEPTAEPADTTTNVTIDPAPDATAPDAAEPAAPADGSDAAPAVDPAAPAAPATNP
jgi:hypothetical protein